MNEYAPCPGCGSNNTERVESTLWGGKLGPKLICHVVCRQCGTTYNGKTGKSNAVNIALYNLVFLLIIVAVIYAIMAVSK